MIQEQSRVEHKDKETNSEVRSDGSLSPVLNIPEGHDPSFHAVRVYASLVRSRVLLPRRRTHSQNQRVTSRWTDPFRRYLPTMKSISG